MIIATIIRCIIGWLLIQKVPEWLNLSGPFATVLRVIGVLIILWALIAWL